MPTPQHAGYKEYIPPGGTAGQVLTKLTDYDFDADWQSPGGGTPGVVPVGGIIIWSGTIAAIAGLTGWAFCDGTANSPGPDLRDRFVVGARQDDVGIAKTNIRGSLEQTASATGHSHSGHANLSHAGLTIGDHTGLTHGLTIADHPDLTHAALSHPALTLTHPDHASRADLSRPSGSIAAHAAGSIPSQSIASRADLSMPSGSLASHAAGSIASQSHTHASIAGVASFASGTNRSGRVSHPTTSGTEPSLANLSGPSRSFASHAAGSLPSQTIASRADISGPSRALASGADVSMPALSHADHSFPSLSHQDIGTHKGTDYGVHTFTAPAAHGAAGTLTHSFSEPDDHVISAHDIVSMVPSFFALAFIQRMA